MEGEPNIKVLGTDNHVEYRNWDETNLDWLLEHSGFAKHSGGLMRFGRVAELSMFYCFVFRFVQHPII